VVVRIVIERVSADGVDTTVNLAFDVYFRECSLKKKLSQGTIDGFSENPESF
jgi:hypothetical protein